MVEPRSHAYILSASSAGKMRFRCCWSRLLRWEIVQTEGLKNGDSVHCRTKFLSVRSVVGSRIHPVRAERFSKPNVYCQFGQLETFPRIPFLYWFQVGTDPKSNLREIFEGGKAATESSPARPLWLAEVADSCRCAPGVWLVPAVLCTASRSPS